MSICIFALFPLSFFTDKDPFSCGQEKKYETNSKIMSAKPVEQKTNYCLEFPMSMNLLAPNHDKE